MLIKTRGIVFRFTKYGETSIIVNIFTEAYGMQGYIVNGVRTNSSKSKIALYQPLTLLDLVAYHKEQADLTRIKEVRCLYQYQRIPVEIRKSTVAMFLNEILNKTIKEESHSEEVFGFLMNSFVTLDQLTTSVENFHLIFLIKLSRFLGFGAQTKNELVGGRFATAETEGLLDILVKADYTDLIQISHTQRKDLLDLLLRFYSDHFETLGELKSLPVLREVLS